MRLIFAFSFVNTAIIPLIISVDFRYNPVLDWFGYLTAGQHADMNHDWYQRIAPELVKSLVILALMPLITLAKDLLIRGVLFYFDNGSFYGTNRKDVS